MIWGGECVKAAVVQPLAGDGSLILEAVYNIDKRHHVCGEKREHLRIIVAVSRIRSAV